MLVGEKVPDATDVSSDADQRPRRPYWPIALLMLGVVMALLGAAFVLDERLRPRVGSETTAVAAPPTPAAAVITATAPPAATALVVAATVIPSPTPTAAATVAATVTPNLVATASALPSRAADLFTPIEREVIDAYLRYWDVRMRAYYDLDTSRLGDVMDGAELEREKLGIEELRSQGRAGRWDVDHNFKVVRATATDAEVYDEYVNHSVLIDAATKQEIPASGPPPVRKITFFLKNVAGTWKVVDGARHD